MTAMIDITFLLIVFFMLVNRIMSEESVRMVLPKLDDPRVVEPGEEGRIVINAIALEPSGMVRDAAHPLAPQGTLAAVKVGLRLIPFAPGWQSQLTEELRLAHERFSEQRGAGEEELEVILRADAALRYEHVEPILESIAAAGLTRINLAAYLPGEGPTMGLGQARE